MANQNILVMLDEFSKRIHDPDNIAVSITEKMSYLNKAMFQFLNDNWTAVNGDKDKFIRIFPELVKPISISLDSNSSYPITSPNFDYFALHSGSLNGNFISVVSADKFAIIKSGKNKYFTGSHTRPIMVEVNRIINVFPKFSTGQTAELLIIKQPLNPTNGNFLTHDGNYDSPFTPQWNSKIVSIAEQLYQIDVGVQV